MHALRRFRIPALFCSFAVLICELISHPFAEMGISDDGPYVLMAQHLARTGHIAYNGWASPILGWQLYLGAAFIKLFGFSYSTVRMSTLLVATALAALLQRTLVRAGISERNATIGTLALAISPLYLMLSVTFMNDIAGLFGLVVCLYGCLRALQAATPNASIGWLCFAVATNAIGGTSRQIAWLGIFLIVPATLWLLRSRHRVVLAGALATLVGLAFIVGRLHWFAQQPYTMPEHLIPAHFPVFHAFSEFTQVFLDLPFLLLPIVVLFLPQLGKGSRRSIAFASLVAAAYALLIILLWPTHHGALLEPTHSDGGSWVGIHGIHEGTQLHGEPPVVLKTSARILLTILSFGGVLGLIASFSRSLPLISGSGDRVTSSLSWKHLGLLLVPYALVYSALLVPRAAINWVFDRYLLEMLVVALLCLVRYYQERIHPRLPAVSLLLVGIAAIYGTICTHNLFALYRARVALASDLRSQGIPDTAVDNGFEYNFGVELQHSNHINEETVVVPAGAYVPTPPPPAGTCEMFWRDKTPHIHPVYGVSFDPNACYGPAPFAPVHYSRWPYATPGTLYVVRYTAPTKP